MYSGEEKEPGKRGWNLAKRLTLRRNEEVFWTSQNHLRCYTITSKGLTSQLELCMKITVATEGVDCSRYEMYIVATQTKQLSNFLYFLDHFHAIENKRN